MFFKMRKALTLIELVITVSILSLGIIMILRSFLSANTALVFSRNQIAASQFLETKLAEAEEKADDPASLKEESNSGEVLLDGRVSARWETELKYVEEEALRNEMYCFKVKLVWSESGRERDLSAATYFKAKK